MIRGGPTAAVVYHVQGGRRQNAVATSGAWKVNASREASAVRYGVAAWSGGEAQPWRRTSYSAIDVAVATFSEATLPGCGT